MDGHGGGLRTYRRPSALNAWVGRMPGPVWTLAVYAVIAATNLLVTVVLSPGGAASHALLVWSAVAAVGIILSLWLLGSRTPPWLIHLYVILIIAMATLLVIDADTPVRAVSAGFGYLTISLYVSYWLPRVQSLVYVFVMALAYLLAIAAAGWSDLLGPWMLTVATMLIVLFVLSTLRQTLESAATIDELTGLLNRRALEDLIAINATDRRERSRVIVAIDLDEFKVLNDRKGHLAGDLALRDFGAACRHSLRPGDLAFRTGGDEFILVLERMTPDGIAPVIERLHANTTIRWSHGCAPWAPRSDFDAALSAADASLYLEKEERRRARLADAPVES